MPCLPRTSYPHSKPQTPQRPHSTLVADAYAALLSSDFPHSHPFISASHHILNGVGDMTHGYGTSLFTFYTLTLPLPVFTPPPRWGLGRPHSLLTPTGGMADHTVFLHPLGAWQTTQSSYTHWGHGRLVSIHPLGAWHPTQSSQPHWGHGRLQSPYTHWGHGRPHSLHTPTGGMADYSLHTPTGGMADYTVFIYSLGAWQTTQSSYTHWGHGRPESLDTPTGGMADHSLHEYVCGLPCHV